MTGDVEHPSAAEAETAPSFDLSKKKKKKKTKTATATETETPAATAAEPETPSVETVTNAIASQKLNDGNTEPIEGEGVEGDQLGPGVQQQQSLDFALPTFGGKKKKKKKKKVDFGDDGAGGDGEADADALPTFDEDGNVTKKKMERQFEPQPWDGTDRDYTYAELINRAFQFLHGKNPSLSAGGSQRKRVRMELPQVAREGTKKTVFFNFGSICKSIHRQQDHFLAYLCAELGTTGNIQEGGRLVIKGRFTPEGIANVLKRYMLEYVICASCRSPDTVLMRDANTRLYFVSCESCGAKRSVAPIRQGFMAQVEKRKK